MAVITANLPSRDFDATSAFYLRLGFTTFFRDKSWMILTFEGTQIEFFPHPDLDPKTSWFSACLHVPDIDALHARWSNTGLPTDPKSFPRLTGPFQPEGGPTMFALLDPDGSLWRVMQDTP